MLEICSSFINCLITSIVGFYITKIIIKSPKKLLNLKTISLLIVSTIITLYLQQTKYMGIHTIIIYILNIITYKIIFKTTQNEAIISTGMVMILVFLSEILLSIPLVPFISMKQIKSSWQISLLLNIVISIITVHILSVEIIKRKLNEFYRMIKSKQKISNSIFFILAIIVVSFLACNLYNNFDFNYDYITNLITMIIIVTLTVIFINSRNNYNNLISQFDNLFIYVQNFEDWIEKEQLNRHEFKNQLAVLRGVTKDKNTKKKIDEILKDNIEIEDEVINQLKHLPKGGIKGLMYYKSAIAQKNKLNLVIDVSINDNSVLNHLNKNDTQTLCKLIGIYYDNAIEAAKETRKKNILIEIYEIKNQTNIVISNTFKKAKNFNSRNEKGVSSKGKGRGNGLYFAKNILSKNKWIEEKQETIDGYYIQTLHIRTKK